MLYLVCLQSYFNDGGGGLSYFFGSEILAKVIFLGL